jgi:hypothetical protein
MRKWMLTIIAGAAITLTFAPDPAAARTAGFHGRGYAGGYYGAAGLAIRICFSLRLR